ncbi:MAG TPA: hypothetical protein VMI06_05670, partial [Terriglobia bacterium]|nr:hypothetical protein [Terriglobia bacterium]
ERVGVTAVRANVFSSGGPVRTGMVRVGPAELARVQVIPHPSVNPRMSAALGGRPVTAPVRTARFTSMAARERLAHVGPAPGPRDVRPNQRLAAPNAATSRGYSRTTSTGYPSTARPRLITRTQPAQRSVPFSTKLRAMESHPGRPLEPQQVNNLRAGKPAGPMRDREYIPHASSANRQKKSAPPPKSKGESESKRRH